MTARNDICPCGSGKRYKHCHGAQDASPLVSPEGEASANAELAESASLAALRKAARAATADEQLALWRALVAESPDDSEAGFNLGNAARSRSNFAEAAAHYESALASTPGHSGLINNLGLVLESLGRLEDAEARFRDALAYVPDGLQPLANLAQNLFQQKRYGDALEYFERLVARHPKIGQASIHANHAMCLMLVNRIAAAEAAMARAMEIEPEHQWIMRNRGVLLARKRDWVGAVAMLEKVLANDPQDLFAASALAHAYGNIANWDDGGAAIEAALARMRGPTPEFAQVSTIDTLAQVDDPVLQRVAGKGWLRSRVAAASYANANKERLHLGFVSSDFCNHPVPRLIMGLLEALDRTRFEVTAIASAPQFFHDEMLSRSKRACDHYVEIGAQAMEAASTARVRELGVDVLFDLNGISGICVPELFAARTAPMQVNFLGYTGTMGGDSHDYLIADSYCIPRDMEGEYNERVLRIDPCYLPSDPARVLADPLPLRARYGLADDALVLAAFGAPFKIRQAMFAAWMSVLRAHPRAVLWLRPANAQVGANLRRYAGESGVAADRLVFAPEEPTTGYLSRFRLADLVLDTFPYGSHTTVNDALFAGAPVLTIAGRTFAARASASQLAAMGLDELIASDLDDYARIAIDLLADRERLASITERVRSPAARQPLFDMQRYAEEFTRVIFEGWRALAEARAGREG